MYKNKIYNLNVNSNVNNFIKFKCYFFFKYMFVIIRVYKKKLNNFYVN